MLHRRRRAVDDRWEACSASDPLRQADSGLHRYSRVVGFSVGYEERRILANDPLAAQAEESARNRVRSQSHSQSHPVQVVPARALLARAPPGRHRVRRLAEAPAPHQRHGGRSKLLGCALLLCRRGRLKQGDQPARPYEPAAGCTPHSIRRSAAQWAGRCGADINDVRNCGRWKTMEMVIRYMAQGALQREQYQNDEDGDGQDPIFRMFVFKPVTESAASGQDIM